MSAVNHVCLHIDGGVAWRIDIGTLNVISASSLTYCKDNQNNKVIDK
jgi:hypothetical protein